MFSGTFINMLTVLIGSSIGILAGNRLPEKMHQSVTSGLGLVTLIIGTQSALGTGNIIVPLLSLVVGVIIGELLDLDGALKRLGGWLQAKFVPAHADAADARIQARLRFINGFVTSTLVFCIGPLTIIGSMQSGMSGDSRLIIIKATLDFFASMAFAASFGIGVAFSAAMILVVQGGFVIFGALTAGALAGSTATLYASPYIRELTASGGLILLAIGLLLLDIKQLRVVNYLPALVIAPLLVALASLLHIAVYPV